MISTRSTLPLELAGDNSRVEFKVHVGLGRGGGSSSGHGGGSRPPLGGSQGDGLAQATGESNDD